MKLHVTAIKFRDSSAAYGKLEPQTDLEMELSGFRLCVEQGEHMLVLDGKYVSEYTVSPEVQAQVDSDIAVMDSV